jgi:MoxR-like ATPase
MSEDLNPTITPQAMESTTHYPERLTNQGPDYVPEDIEVPAAERETGVTGYLEWEWDYKETARALNLDFKHYLADLPRAELERLAQPRIEAINHQRTEQGGEPIDATTADTIFLGHLIRPSWHEHMPKSNSEEDLQKWEAFKHQWPEHMRINLEGLRKADGMLRALANDEQLRQDVEANRGHQLEIIREAVAFERAGKKVDNLARDIARIYRAAGDSNRRLTFAEEEHIQRLREQQAEVMAERGRGITSQEIKEEVKGVVQRLRDRERRRDYERGIVLTEQMKTIIENVLPSLVKGQPALFVGETGGAKTALAEFISRSYFGKEAELISGYADVNSYQIMGKMGFKNQESVFEPGPIPRAMEAGKPVILDEVTRMPAEFLGRLNKIMQLRPGDRFTIQEDTGREVVVKPGFVIIATANEKSKRYKGVEDLSVEFQNRFGANVVRIRYPDNDVVFGQNPLENMIIARAALTDQKGQFLPVIKDDELERFVKACHISQQVFSGNFGEGFQDFVSPENLADRRPGLDETVLAPRTMVAILEKLRDSHGQASLDVILKQFVDGIKSPNDKNQIALILQGHGFLRASQAA